MITHPEAVDAGKTKVPGFAQDSVTASDDQGKTVVGKGVMRQPGCIHFPEDKIFHIVGEETLMRGILICIIRRLATDCTLIPFCSCLGLNTGAKKESKAASRLLSARSIILHTRFSAGGTGRAALLSAILDIRVRGPATESDRGQ